MEPKDRIIVALDVDRPDRAIELVERLRPHVGCFKIGMEFMNAAFMRLATFDWQLALKELMLFQRLFKALDGKIFWDGKFMDIPNTVAGASRAVAGVGIRMFNVHCLGGAKMMKAALAAADEMKVVSPTGKRPLVLGVTVLTSLGYEDLVEIGLMQDLNIHNPEDLERAKRMNMEWLVVRHLAWLAQESGLDGVIASPMEVEAIREYCQPEFKIVTPGVRPAWAYVNDQKRVMTPSDAVKAGADYLVIGRPITRPPADIGSPAEAAMRIADEIADAAKGAA